MAPHQFNKESTVIVLGAFKKTKKNHQEVNKLVNLNVVLCLPASGAEVSHLLGQGSSFRSEAGAAHPDGPPSQPHALHRCQVTTASNRLHPISIPVFPFHEAASLHWQLVKKRKKFFFFLSY